MKYLVVNPFGIGDVLFTTPVLRAIKQKDPDNFIGYWSNARTAEILRNNHRVDKVFALSRGDLKKTFRRSRREGLCRLFDLLKQIRREKFDCLLDFSLEHRYAFACWLMGIRRRVGFDYLGRGRFLTVKVPISGFTDRHVVEYYLELLPKIGIPVPDDKTLELFISESARKKAFDVLEAAGVTYGDPVIGIAPGAGASWGRDASIKHWPAQRFAMVADTLIQEFHAKVLLLGDISERPIAESIASAMKNKAVDLVGKTTLEELSGIMGSLKVLLANDGGPLHMAVAAGVRTVSFFGPVDESVYGPYPASESHVTIKTELDCRPCYRQFRRQDCTRNRECLTSIDTAEVLRVIRRFL